MFYQKPKRNYSFNKNQIEPISVFQILKLGFSSLIVKKQKEPINQTVKKSRSVVFLCSYDDGSMVELQKESFCFGLYQRKGTVLNVPLQIITSYIIIIFFNGFEFKKLYFKKVSGKKERCFIINGCFYINFVVHIVSELQ